MLCGRALKAITYVPSAPTSTEVKPKFIDTTTVRTDPTTLNAPLTAHAHGMSAGFIRSSRRIPYAKGTPSKKAVGASATAVIAALAGSGHAMQARRTNGKKSRNSPSEMDSPRGTSHAFLGSRSNQRAEKRLPRPVKKRMQNRDSFATDTA